MIVIVFKILYIMINYLFFKINFYLIIFLSNFFTTIITTNNNSYKATPFCITSTISILIDFGNM